MATCYIGLGSNLGNRRGYLVAALELMAQLPGTRVSRVSRFVETSPVGGPSGQEPFLNAAAELDTVLTPLVLLERLREIENRLGRVRREHWGARVIDLDILLCGDARVDTLELTVPHPHLHFRRFVLEPLVEIAPQARHPAGWTIAQRWERLNRLPHYLAITGPMGVGKTTVARELAARLDAVFVAEQFDGETLGRLYEGERAAGPAVQRGFLASRCDLLNRSCWEASPPRWLVSDFWFAQSLAYAELVLEAPECDSHRREVERAAAEVLDPTLVVWLHASAEELAVRVRGRGRDFERLVEPEYLAALETSFTRALTGPAAPPLYRARASAPDELIAELLVIASAIAG